MQTETTTWIPVTKVLPGSNRVIQIYVSEELTGAHIINDTGAYIHKGVWIGLYEAGTFLALVNPKGEMCERRHRIKGATHWAELLQPPTE